MIRILNGLFWMHRACMFNKGNGDQLNQGIQIQASFFSHFTAGKILFLSYMEVLLHLTV